jgi:hypothetical protein
MFAVFAKGINATLDSFANSTRLNITCGNMYLKIKCAAFIINYYNNCNTFTIMPPDILVGLY